MIRLLLVDDDEKFRRFVSMILKQCLDITIVGEAVDGNAALAFLAAHAHDVDVMTTDWEHPPPDGVELAAMVRAAYPHIRIALLTGYDIKGHVRGWDNVPFDPQLFDAVLTKPFRAEVFCETIRAVAQATKP